MTNPSSAWNLFLGAVLVVAGGCGTGLPGPGSQQDGGMDAGVGGGFSVDGGSPEVPLAEYTPPTGAAPTGAEPDGPGPRRILLATSTDGVTFTRLERKLIDQANTPNMVVLPSGRLLVYYTGYQLAGTFDGVGVAVSDDNAATWRFYKAQLNGLSSPPSIGDPDVVYDASTGSYRLYVTHGTGAGTIAIKSLKGADGFNFTYEGLAFNPGSQAYKDSLTQKVGSGFVQFTLHSSDGFMGRATSSDGKAFTLVDTKAYNNGAVPFVLSNWLGLGNGTYRVYGFRGLGADSVIKSFTTTDGVTFTPDTTTCLKMGSSPLEKTFVKDAAVARMGNGTYLMAYVSEIP